MAGIATVVLALLCAGCGGSSRPGGSSTTGASPLLTTATGASSGGAPESSRWLGLNYNSGSGDGTVDEFSRHGIVYDRLGALEQLAGTTTASSPELASGLARSIRAGMVPDILIDSDRGPGGCSANPDPTDLCLPLGQGDVDAYVRGFVSTVVSIRREYPHQSMLFEPTDEPWDWASPPGSSSGRLAAQQYAALLAQLLPAIRTAGIPLSQISVPATGTLADGTQWISDLYASQPCLAPGPSSCGPIEGWNVHPYGPPDSTVLGISSLPPLRLLMKSGSDNIVASEMGFCATDVDSGEECELNTPAVDGTSQQTARWLAEALNAAESMHAAGWLRGLIIWERAGGGWSMVTSGGALTAQGRELIKFAETKSASAR